MVSKRDAIRQLWKIGNLDYKRHAGQIKMKKYILESGMDQDIITILASRQLGKSYEALLEAVELCNAKKNASVKYICPKLRMVKNIVNKKIRVIL